MRQTEVKNTRNKYYHKTARNAMKALRNTSEKEAALVLLPKVTAMLDKLAKNNVIHKNKAANLKSSTARKRALVRVGPNQLYGSRPQGRLLCYAHANAWVLALLTGVTNFSRDHFSRPPVRDISSLFRPFRHENLFLFCPNFIT